MPTALYITVGTLHEYVHMHFPVIPRLTTHQQPLHWSLVKLLLHISPCTHQTFHYRLPLACVQAAPTGCNMGDRGGGTRVCLAWYVSTLENANTTGKQNVTALSCRLVCQIKSLICSLLLWLEAARVAFLEQFWLLRTLHTHRPGQLC